MNPGSIDQHKLKELLSLALAEDVGDGDHTSLATVSSAAKGIAEVRCKGDGIFAGSVVAPALFNLVDDAVQLRSFVTEGDEVTAGKIAMQVDGSIQSLLKAERILLNCMQRMSGIATFTRKFVTEVAGTNARILDTRKTTPNFRLLEKWAVKAGGGFNHRFGLYDMILIKDNHVDACGGVRNAIEKANAYLQQTGKTLAIEIEIRNAGNRSGRPYPPRQLSTGRSG